MKILVTGATGFIGRHVIRYLLNYDISIIATSISEEEDFSEFKGIKNIQYFKCDLTNEELDFYEFFQKPDILIHLAWGNLPDYNSVYHLDVNLIAHLKFIRSIIGSGLKKLSVIGTCLEYGLQNGCLSEEDETYPVNAYAIAKDIIRRFIEGYAVCKNFEYNWIRLFYTYGPGQNKNSLIAQLDRAIEDKDAVFNMSEGEQLRDFLPVQKVAEYIVRISLHRSEQRIINCCSGNPVSVRKFVEEYLISKHSKIELNLGYYPYPGYEPMAFWGNNSKLKTITG